MPTQNDALDNEAKAVGTRFPLANKPLACVITRFRLRTALALPLFYIVYRKVRRVARERVPGLITSAFLVENPRVCYTLSLWHSDDAISDFNRLIVHVKAGNWCMRYVYDSRKRKAGLCTFHLRLLAHGSNVYWEGIDLAEILAATPVPFRTHQPVEGAAG